MNELEIFLLKEAIIKAIRRFFYEKDFHEVVPAVLNYSIPIEPNIYSFSTKGSDRTFHLSTSPEKSIKKMLAKGLGNCFALGKCFRNLEGSGNLHLPEYSMLEWYREDAVYSDIIKDLKELIAFINKTVDAHFNRNYTGKLIYQGKEIILNNDWPVFSLPELFEKYCGVAKDRLIQDDYFFQKASEKGYKIKNSSWNELFDQIFVNEIEPKMPKEPHIIKDFPARLSPLCKVNKDNSDLAERFEFFICGMEIANGNNENTDYKAVREQFEKEITLRSKNNLYKDYYEVPSIDTDFINCLEKISAQNKNYAGIGLGIDRLVMIMANVDSVKRLL